MRPDKPSATQVPRVPEGMRVPGFMGAMGWKSIARVNALLSKYSGVVAVILGVALGFLGPLFNSLGAAYIAGLVSPGSAVGSGLGITTLLFFISSGLVMLFAVVFLLLWVLKPLKLMGLRSNGGLVLRDELRKAIPLLTRRIKTTPAEEENRTEPSDDETHRVIRCAYAISRIQVLLEWERRAERTLRRGIITCLAWLAAAAILGVLIALLPQSVGWGLVAAIFVFAGFAIALAQHFALDRPFYTTSSFESDIHRFYGRDAESISGELRRAPDLARPTVVLGE